MRNRQRERAIARPRSRRIAKPVSLISSDLGNRLNWLPFRKCTLSGALRKRIGQMLDSFAVGVYTPEVCAAVASAVAQAKTLMRMKASPHPRSAERDSS